MENTKKTVPEIMNLYYEYMKASKIDEEFRESSERKRLKDFMESLNYIAGEWLLFHDNKTCCFKHTDRHFEFQIGRAHV